MHVGARKAEQRSDHAVCKRQAPHLLPLAHGRRHGVRSQAHRQGCPGMFLRFEGCRSAYGMGLILYTYGALMCLA